MTGALQNLCRVVKSWGVVGIALWGARVDWENAIETAAKKIM
jgi:hypothetical protein